jgi:hypothetical protein
MGIFITVPVGGGVHDGFVGGQVPLPPLVQYTLVASAAMAVGYACPAASTVGVPPAEGTDWMVPSLFAQNTMPVLAAMPDGPLCPEASVVG